MNKYIKNKNKLYCMYWSQISKGRKKEIETKSSNWKIESSYQKGKFLEKKKRERKKEKRPFF